MESEKKCFVTITFNLKNNNFHYDEILSVNNLPNHNEIYEFFDIYLYVCKLLVQFTSLVDSK